MTKLKKYLEETLRANIQPKLIKSGNIPFYINEIYRFYRIIIMGRELVLIEPRDNFRPTVRQMEKEFNVIGNTFNAVPVLTLKHITSINRKRLIEKGINFIVSGKQIYLPSLMLDLKESFREQEKQKTTLLPSAQLFLLYKILKRSEKIEEHSLKQIAAKLNYTSMTITIAVDNLQEHGLCEVHGSKEKYVHFIQPVSELWSKAWPLMPTPVIKQVFVDALPKGYSLLRSNASALPEYSNMNESAQAYYAMNKNLFHQLRKGGQLQNANPHEGTYCLEIWKYDPAILSDTKTVDPLSLYLSMKDYHDERIQAALDEIVRKTVW